MKFNKSVGIILLLLVIILVGWIIYNNINKPNETISNIKIEMGDSGYTLSTLKNNKKYLNLIFTSNVEKNTLSEDSVDVTYEYNGVQIELKPVAYAYNHDVDKAYNEFQFESIPKNIDEINVILKYGKFNDFTTKKISLKR